MPAAVGTGLRLEKNIEGVKWTYNSINRYSTLALKSAFLINAGACGLWLTFIGVMISNHISSVQILIDHLNWNINHQNR